MRIIICFLTLLIGQCFAQNWNYYYGNIHAHSGYSDGNKDSLTSGMYTPYEDFLYANESQNIDFYGISEHNHYGGGMSSKNDYYAGVADAELATIEDSFVALYGMEWGVIASGGHVLIYGYDSLIGWQNNLYDAYVGEFDYSGLWQTINSKPNCFTYFAHPQSTDYDSLFYFPVNPIADQAIVGMAFRSGPAFSTNFTYSNPTSSSYWTRYNDALKRGYHLGVGLDHDTHYSVFGRSQQGRMGLMAPLLTKQDILYGMRKMRMYSTDDWNFRVNFQVNEEAMGSIITQAGNPTIFIDCFDLDLSENISNIYIYHGVPGSGQQATLLTQAINSFTHVFTHAIQDGETYYYYARIVENDGDEIFTSPIWYTRNDAQTIEPPTSHFTLPNNPICIGENLALSFDGIAENATFYWTFSGNALPNYANTQNTNVVFNQAGIYHITLYVENAAGSTFYSQDVVVEGCAGLVDHGNGYKIFPNPAQDLVQITHENSALQIQQISLIDAFGRTFIPEFIRYDYSLEISTANIPNGAYSLCIDSESQRIIEKLWVQH